MNILSFLNTIFKGLIIKISHLPKNQKDSGQAGMTKVKHSLPKNMDPPVEPEDDKS